MHSWIHFPCGSYLWTLFKRSNNCVGSVISDIVSNEHNDLASLEKEKKTIPYEMLCTGQWWNIHFVEDADWNLKKISNIILKYFSGGDFSRAYHGLYKRSISLCIHQKKITLLVCFRFEHGKNLIYLLDYWIGEHRQSHSIAL